MAAFFLYLLAKAKKAFGSQIRKRKDIIAMLSPLSLQVLEILTMHGRLGISEIAALSRANRNTLKKTLAALVKDNYVLRHGVGKSSWYSRA